MSVLCSAFIFYFISFVSLSVCFTLPSSRKVREEKSVQKLKGVDDDFRMIVVLLKPCNRDDTYHIDGDPQSNRVKRSSDIAKFSASKNLSQTKVVQLYLQLYKDLYTTRYATKPIHPETMKPVLKKFKKKLVRIFFPEAALSNP